MKIKKLSILAFSLSVLFLSSCGYYTSCPTYAKDHKQDQKEIMAEKQQDVPS